VKPTITQKVKDYIERLDITTATLYSKDRKVLEELRIEYIYKSKQDIGVTDFLSHVIKFYKEKRRR
jgi:hypothetical protein